MRRSYAALIALYPPEYRGLFADEMAAVFEQASRERRMRGWTAYAAFLGGELFGLVRGAASEWSGCWRRRPSHRIFTFLAGAVISFLYLGPLFHQRVLLSSAGRLRQIQEFAQDEVAGLLVLATISIVLIAAFSVAFVMNLRSVAQRRRSKT